jgi:ankyrin repeat protein
MGSTFTRTERSSDWKSVTFETETAVTGPSICQLKRAVADGDFDLVLKLAVEAYDERPDIGLSDVVVDRLRGDTALMTAVRRGHYHLVPVLMMASPSPPPSLTGDECSRSKRTLCSRLSTHRSVIRLLLQRVFLEQPSKEGDTDHDDDDDDDETDNFRSVTAGMIRLARRRCDNVSGDCRSICDDDDNDDRRRCHRKRRHLATDNVTWRLPAAFHRRYAGSSHRRHDVDCLTYVIFRLSEAAATAGIGGDGRIVVDSRPLNSDGDTAIILAVRHRLYALIPKLLAVGYHVGQQNDRGKTALDELIEALFPMTEESHESSDVNNNYIFRRRRDSPVLRFRPEPRDGVVDDWSSSRLPAVMQTLLDAGAAPTSLYLGWFLLHCVHDAYIVRHLILSCFPADYDTGISTALVHDRHRSGSGWRLSDNHRQLFRLLLQTAVKFDQLDNAQLLLRRVAILSSASTTTFWMPDSLAAEARCHLPGDSVLTWSTVRHLADRGRIGLLADRILDALPLPVGGALVLLRAVSKPQVVERVVRQLLHIVSIDDNYETGRAIEIFYQYSMMSRQVEHRHRLFRVLAAAGPRLSVKAVQLLAA